MRAVCVAVVSVMLAAALSAQEPRPVVIGTNFLEGAEARVNWS